ncbi:Phosphatidic acid phosphatase2 family protein [Klebsormidium nitens]|uniref:Phosphatidic acid phosphatase2 family protein n=1 Tax=Klebsormidium nitens TaxID=105231 RepID=A0A1Y1HNX8_KLENI|nr:Phosphatidic acid phosphatase2 family protein [Klebsormidium nitens]|eukprot:GAQ78267.1 Phosphatidic acid phosphatase2 family protein [Klebsormidium nitens]
MLPPVYKSVELTHVRYPEGDGLGKLLALASLAPYTIAFGAFPALIIFRRELQTMVFCLGLIVNEALCQSLKRFFMEPRPPSCAILECCSSFGWPSSHSAWVTFFATYSTLLCLRRLTFSDWLSKWAAVVIPWPVAFSVMWSRAYLGYHTWRQVWAGGAIGCCNALAWYVISACVFIPTFRTIEDHPICRYLCIRDSSHIPNVMLAEYRHSRVVRKQNEFEGR